MKNPHLRGKDFSPGNGAIASFNVKRRGWFPLSPFFDSFMDEAHQKYLLYRADQLLTDPLFLGWIFTPCPEIEKFWSELISEHPKMSSVIINTQKHLICDRTNETRDDFLPTSYKGYCDLVADLDYQRKKYDDSTKWIESCFRISKNYWHRLQHQVMDHEFKSVKEEILFFKIIKPLFVSEIEYYSLLYYAELFCQSVYEPDILYKFWSREFQRLEKLINENRPFYDYYKSGDQYMDEDWFVRKNNDFSNFLKTRVYDLEEAATTSRDYLLSMLLALERYCTHAEEEKIKYYDIIKQ